jgi:hypothetical protein
MKLLLLIVSVITQLPELLGLVNTTVKEVETTLAGSPGTAKLAAVVAKINTYLTAAEADATTLANVQSVLTPLINAAVAAFNAAGLFVKGATKA